MGSYQWGRKTICRSRETRESRVDNHYKQPEERVCNQRHVNTLTVSKTNRENICCSFSDSLRFMQRIMRWSFSLYLRSGGDECFCHYNTAISDPAHEPTNPSYTLCLCRIGGLTPGQSWMCLTRMRKEKKWLARLYVFSCLSLLVHQVPKPGFIDLLMSWFVKITWGINIVGHTKPW